jgi:hypothetical protein
MPGGPFGAPNAPGGHIRGRLTSCKKFHVVEGELTARERRARRTKALAISMNSSRCRSSLADAAIRKHSLAYRS